MAAHDYDVVALVRACEAAGLVYGKGLQNAVAVSLTEDNLRDLTAVFVNSDQWSSRDRGPFQINDHWHPEVTDACAFDLACSAKEAFRISNSGANFGPWATYASGKYRAQLDLAFAGIQWSHSLDQIAADQLQAKALQAQLAKAGDDLSAAKAQAAALTAQLATANATLADAQDQLVQDGLLLKRFRDARDAVIALKDV